jgi:hypothetical protein
VKAEVVIIELAVLSWIGGDGSPFFSVLVSVQGSSSNSAHQYTNINLVIASGFRRNNGNSWSDFEQWIKVELQAVVAGAYVLSVCHPAVP